MVVDNRGQDEPARTPLRSAGIEVLELGHGDRGPAWLVDELAGADSPDCSARAAHGCTAICSPAVWSTSCHSTLAPVAVGGLGSRTTGATRCRRCVDFELQFSLLGDDGALFTSYRRRSPA